MKSINLIDKAFILKRIAIFKDLDLDLLLTVADKMHLATYHRMEAIFTSQQEATKMYFLVEGSVSIRDDRQQELALLYPYDFFGDESLFSEKSRAYEALAQTETLLLTLSRTNLVSIIFECPTVAIGLLESYATATNFRSPRTYDL